MTTRRPAMLPIRQSCDRCHGQKLRCVRQSPGETTSPCIRCLRLGQDVRCVYSATLPKGRPSAHHRNHRNSPPLTAEDSGCSHMAFALAQAPLESFMEDNDMWMWDAEEFRSVDTSTSAGASTSASTSTSASANADEADGNIYTEMAMPMPMPMPSAMTMQTPTADEDEEDDIIAQLSALSMRLYPLYRTTCAVSPRQAMVPDRAINRSGSGPVISEAVLASATAWLVNSPHDCMGGNTPNARCETLNALEQNIPLPAPAPASVSGTPAAALSSSNTMLHDMFSASRQLLEILRHRANFAPQNSQSVTPASSSYSQPASLTTTTTTTPASTASDTVVRHLVLANHTLLLNIYSTLLPALQHDAELQRDVGDFQSTRQDSSSFPRDPTHTSAVIMADMRITLVVQLCSYFIQRLRQAVLLYFSSRPLSPLDDGSSLGAVGDLEMQVQQHLSRLQQTLHL